MSDDAAVDALMASFDKGDPKAAKPSDEEAEAEDGEEENEPATAGEEGDEDASEEGEDDGPEDEESDPATAAPKEAADDQVVKVTFDGETKDFTVKDLKRLAGQEASLTRKSQEADAVGGRAAAALNAAIETALEDLEPYKSVDWLTLQNELDPGEFKWHRDNAAKAQARFDKLVGAAGSVDQALSARKTSVDVESAQAALRELQTDIEGWNDKLYGDILSYGVSQGLSENDVKAISNAKVIKLLHKAMLHDAGAKAVAKKVKAAPEKVLKTSRQSAPDGKSEAVRKSAKRLQSGRGSDADAIAVLTGRWS